MIHVNARAIIERESEGQLEIVVQNRVKPNEPVTIELPGGRIEPFESLIAALRREVREETGLELTEIEGEELRTVTEGPVFQVECVVPFVAFQSLKGPVDSAGYFFRCKAAGDPLSSGDQTEAVRWMRISELRTQIDEHPAGFSDVDLAAIKYYLRHLEGAVRP